MVFLFFKKDVHKHYENVEIFKFQNIQLYIVVLANLKEFIYFGIRTDILPSLINLLENWTDRISEGVGGIIVEIKKTQQIF